MPVTPTYPGVYIEELPSGVRTITGVATSITAFVGFAKRGLTNEPIRIQSFGDFERQFGGLSVNSMMSYAVQQYFLNGGSDAIIVRLANQDSSSTRIDVGTLTLHASSEGSWGDGLKIVVDHKTSKPEVTFNLEAILNANDQEIARETFRNLSVDSASSRYVRDVLNTQSGLVRILEALPENAERPESGTYDASMGVSGSDGDEPTDDTLYVGSEANKTGLYALEKADLFNLLCIPPVNRGIDISADTWIVASAYCEKRRAMLIVDPPMDWAEQSNVANGLGGFLEGFSDKKNAALFFPRVKFPDALKENRLETFVPSGAIAGVFARTDANRGVWKAPAGTEATLAGVRGLSVNLTDGENGILNPLGVNCLRNFPVYGNVIWGSRTLDGDDRLASEWKYIPVRRLTLFLQESLYRGTQWVVFEPNDEPLWSQIRLNLGAFMNNLFKQGAFQGKTPRDAYFVKCDSETTTQNDIDRGIVNIIVGFAPLKPAEFVIIKFQQIAGDLAT